MGQLPEQVQANLATLQRLQLEQQMVADSLRKATDALLLMESTSGPAPVAPGAPAAPDSLSALRALMAQLKTRYTDEHPDVRALQGRIDALEKAAASAKPDAPVTDPAAAAAQLRLREARLEVQAQRERLADVDRRIAGFQERVEAAPRREQEVLGLMRDYQKLSENYSALLSKKLDAEMASRLEQQQKGQQFRVLDPAYLPERASFPNRGLFALAGALVGLLLGVGLAVTIDVLDPTMKDAESVAAAFTFPVLAVIPYVKPREQARLARLPVDAPAEAGHSGAGVRGGRWRSGVAAGARTGVEDAVSDPNAVKLVESSPAAGLGPAAAAGGARQRALPRRGVSLPGGQGGRARERALHDDRRREQRPERGQDDGRAGPHRRARAHLGRSARCCSRPTCGSPRSSATWVCRGRAGSRSSSPGRTQNVPVRTVDAARASRCSGRAASGWCGRSCSAPTAWPR